MHKHALFKAAQLGTNTQAIRCWLKVAQGATALVAILVAIVARHALLRGNTRQRHY